ncbi:hypothetical protein N7533_003522 [Penicillium manginii]|uniref:uncharacterized protein n=1 Tax=Penicillium manginii TaxID=203109 RepID=UPI0025485974|nr:uncharacterized protein N7533_003522 [Penicillium manginii]KAJ5761483.1 hypothetical protein N7533_003522 [Penicillium manginii]
MSVTEVSLRHERLKSLQVLATGFLIEVHAPITENRRRIRLPKDGASGFSDSRRPVVEGGSGFEFRGCTCTT